MMAAIRLSFPLIVATMSLALQMNVPTLSWAQGTIESVEQMLSEEVKPFWDRIWSVGLTPNEVLEDLIKIKNLIEKYNMAETFRAHKDEIDTLISWSKPDKERCDDRFIKELESRTKEYFLYGSVYNYSKHYGLGYLLICTVSVLDEMEEKVQKIRHDDKKNIDDLESELRQALPQYCRMKKRRDNLYRKYTDLELYHQHLITALDRFLISRSANQMTKNFGPDRMYILYKRYVLDACRSWLSATDRARGMDRHLRPFRNLEQDEKRHYHINRADICKYISDNNEQILKDLQLPIGV